MTPKVEGSIRSSANQYLESISVSRRRKGECGVISEPWQRQTLKIASSGHEIMLREAN